jgi:hypothetical protein
VQIKDNRSSVSSTCRDAACRDSIPEIKIG